MTSKSKYLRLRDQLLTQIKSGHFPDGKLHPLLRIAKDNKVSLVTAQKAVKLLEQEGIVTCNPDNRGTVINQGKADFLNGAAAFNPFRDVVVYSKRKVKINYFNSEYYSFTKTGWDNIVAAFQRQYPWIEVQFADPANFSDPAQHQVPYDAFQIISRDLQSLVKQGIVAPLDEFPCKDCLAALHAQAVPSCFVGETMYALPQSFSIPLMFYHKRRLAGMLPKEQITRWDVLDKLIEKIGKHGFATYLNIGLWSYWSYFIGNVSANLMKNQHDATLLSSLELLKRINALAPHSLSEDFFTDNGALFCLNSSCTDLFTEHLDDWSAQALPLTPSGHCVFTPLLNCVDARSPHHDEAFLFIKFLTSEYAQKQLALHNSSYPFHKEFMRRDFYAQHRSYLRELDIDTMLNACKPIPPTSTFLNILYDNIFLPALTKYYTTSVTTRSLLDYLKSRIAELYPVYMKKTSPKTENTE